MHNQPKSKSHFPPSAVQQASAGKDFLTDVAKRFAVLIVKQHRYLKANEKKQG